jgi:glutathione synthase/RimK-type ligase-like ATP-grasp enzyme
MVEVTERLHRSFRDLAARVASDMDLRFLGLDLIAGDVAAPAADYAILEINAAPGLDHYGGIGPGHEARIDALYTKVLEAIARGPRRVAGRRRRSR